MTKRLQTIKKKMLADREVHAAYDDLADEFDIGIGGDHRGCLMSDPGIDKVDIGFIDEQHAAEGQRELMEFGCRGKRA